ncbi:MAG: hypothetical protein U9M90_01535 [Patescibacteria group bacterium]|nr:hypothetical protein [Patescibacteria group bacterium]
MNNMVLKNLISSLLLVFCSICALLLIVSFAEQKMFSKGTKGSVLAAGTCPAGPGYAYVLAGDFCIEKDLHDAGSPLSWEDAAMACVEDDGARLCRASEWAQACNMQDHGDITLDNMESRWEWTDDFININEAIKIGNGDCETYGDDQPFNAGIVEEYRCCKNAVN